MRPTKRFILGIIGVTLVSFFPTYTTSASEETYFITTAYYSPLPNQEKYFHKTYSREIRVNGNGTHGASGKEVFVGMLAGPANYPFGTKIYLEGYGIAEVADRGGAIVKKGVRGFEHDRIDIWMGYGDAGRERAVAWGTRTVKGKIVVPSAGNTLSFDADDSSVKPIGRLTVNPENSETEDVKKLQEFFASVGLYDGEIDGEFSSIESTLIDFQIDKGIINSKESEAAGWFGTKTLNAISQEFNTGVGSILREEDTSLFSNYNHKLASEIYKTILEYGDLQVTPDSDQESIQSLQKLMQTLGEYSGPISGNYKDVEKPLIALQKKIGLIRNDEDWGAGYFGNKTKTALWDYYESHEIPEAIDGNNNSNQLEDIKADIEKGHIYILTENEKIALEKAIEKMYTTLQKQEKRTGRSADKQFDALMEQIGDALPKVEDPVLRAKLVYIGEIISKNY